METPKKKRQEFEPLVPLGIFLIVFGLVITYAASIPPEWSDKIVDLAAGLAFLTWGGAWFYVGRRRSQKAREQRKDEKL
jgi:hypothetical protein